MSNFFQKVGAGFVWIGKELAKAAEWVPKLVTLVNEVKADAGTILPEIATVIDDAGDVATAAVTDSGAAIAAAQNLVAAIVAAAKADALNIAADETVASTFQTFITEVSTKSTWGDVLTALQQLVTDYDTLGGAVKTALTQLEAAAN